MDLDSSPFSTTLCNSKCVPPSKQQPWKRKKILHTTVEGTAGGQPETFSILFLVDKRIERTRRKKKQQEFVLDDQTDIDILFFLSET